MNFSGKISVTSEGHTAVLYPAAAPSAPLIILCEEMAEGPVLESLAAIGCPDFSLLFAHVDDWNHDLSPWNCPPVFRKGEPFTGGADTYLPILTGRLLEEAVKKGGLAPAWYGITGYSLAGLFAIYSLYQTDLFTRAASMSGSLWFPGFADYVRTHRLKKRPDRLYFSLGDREDHTRNELMRSVRTNMEELASYYQSLGIPSAIEINPGNHFQKPELRIAKGIRALLV